ncbi:glycosyltransferase family 4 protein [Bradyrhizobium sp. CCBAU 11361]|uniref:glycosyltransferase family 4 protein n=1 Tax=Bradyrhizobium sp. CCBAU 11361 TaxID=1630812 RepID=UPI003FA463B3
MPQLVDALGKLACRTNWTAITAGSGEIQQTRDRAQRLGIADRVDFPGWLGPSETAALLQQTDILALPSFVESLPMSIIEAYAYGAAVVATPAGAVPEVIAHERNGLLVPVGDAEALANALKRLLEDGALRRRLGDAARRDHAERYESAWRRFGGRLHGVESPRDLCNRRPWPLLGQAQSRVRFRRRDHCSAGSDENHNEPPSEDASAHCRSGQARRIFSPLPT